MALLTLPFSSETQKVQSTNRKKQHKQKRTPKSKQQNPSSSSSSSSWDQFKNLLTCKQMDVVGTNKAHEEVKNLNGYSKLKSCSSICSFRDVVHGNTRVVHRADNSPESSTVGVNSGVLSRKKQLTDGGSSSTSKTHGSYTSSSTTRAMQFRKLSGCYECHAIVDPLRYTIPRSTICVCSKCGEVFPKMESLEHHHAVRHAVSELGPEDSGRNIVEIIFKSSWLKPNQPIFTIERILKVHNTRRTIQRFEDCRDAVKLGATATATRCAADGNELLRFYCTTVVCPLGARNSSSLCTAVNCGVCHVIRHGFQNPKSGGHSGGAGGGGGGGGGGVKSGVRTTVGSGGCGGGVGGRGDGGGGGVRTTIGSGSGGGGGDGSGGGGVKGVVRMTVSSGGGGGGGGSGGAVNGGVRTTASSGRAHDCLGGGAVGERRAMLVCRVIAGKVKRVAENVLSDEEEDGLYDSVAGNGGLLYSSLEELYVFNPRAILPCFVVIYKALESSTC